MGHDKSYIHLDFERMAVWGLTAKPFCKAGFDQGCGTTRQGSTLTKARQGLPDLMTVLVIKAVHIRS